jgi:hypothetical protein
MLERRYEMPKSYFVEDRVSSILIISVRDCLTVLVQSNVRIRTVSATLKYRDEHVRE